MSFPDSVNSVTFTDNENLIFVACQNNVLDIFTCFFNFKKVLGFDLRRPEIILKNADITFSENSDEVNQVRD